MRSSFLMAGVAMLAAALAAMPAHAIPRTFLSNTGSGTACSRTAPCADLLTALKATDQGGEINCLDAGDFGGVLRREAKEAQYAFGVVAAGVLGRPAVQDGAHHREQRATGGEQRDSLIGDVETTCADAAFEVALGERAEGGEGDVVGEVKADQ